MCSGARSRCWPAPRAGSARSPGRWPRPVAASAGDRGRPAAPRRRGCVPRSGRVEAGEELDQRGLAGAVQPDDGDRRAGLDLEVEAVEHRLIGAGVAEVTASNAIARLGRRAGRATAAPGSSSGSRARSSVTTSGGSRDPVGTLGSRCSESPMPPSPSSPTMAWRVITRDCEASPAVDRGGDDHPPAERQQTRSTTATRPSDRPPL